MAAGTGTGVSTQNRLPISASVQRQRAQRDRTILGGLILLCATLLGVMTLAARWDITPHVRPAFAPGERVLLSAPGGLNASAAEASQRVAFGRTPAALDQLRRAQTIGDTIGVSKLIASDAIIPVAHGTPALVLNHARMLGARLYEVRIVGSGTGNEGAAGWVAAAFVIQ